VLASSIAMALYHREKSGHGQALHVPMLETMLSFLLPEHLWGQSINRPELGIGYSRMLTPHRRPFATLDGHICLIAVTDDQYARLLPLLGKPELVADPRFASVASRADNVEIVYGTIAAAMKARSTADWLALLATADLPHGPANTLEELMTDDYLREGGFFQQIDHPSEGMMTTLAIPVAYDGSPATIRRGPPRLGEHTAEVLSEAGFSATEIAALGA
jgi:crotonobetainyl-CoA:carnitine CoA-transferase CaiB-like acyl-CoA transferase